ncbi:MAG: helix-turn-helix transcriptional regulator [Spirochaetales bacterium]|nr:helix-turn-helix transcriptional regulator [Spirochaetales bacterium]
MARMAFSEKVKIMRKEKGLKQEQLAEKCGVSVDAVGTWEQGGKIPVLDNLIKLADTFDCSLDVFRQDAPNLDLHRPSWTQDDYIANDIPFRFGSTKPDTRQQAILDFCGMFLDSLDERYFIKGVGQNSQYGTGRYFWESKIDLPMFIGFTPTLTGTKCRYAYSVCVETGKPLPSDLLATFDCLQEPDGDDTNWIFVPIDLDETDSERMLSNAKKSLKTVIEISRIAIQVMTMEVMETLSNE